MEKERRVKALSIVALLIAIVGLTVAFAAMSRLLTINGSASVGKFDVHFETNNDFNGQGKIYNFTGTTGVSDATIEAGEEGTAEIVDGITVNNLKAQFDRTGDDSKATFKLYIVNDSNSTAYVQTVTFLGVCNQTNSIVCELKDMSGNNISEATSIAAHGNMFVQLIVTAPDAVGSNTQDNNYVMGVQVLFGQDSAIISGASSQGGSTPIPLDDDAISYPISGTLTGMTSSNQVSYTLTSDGKLILNSSSSTLNFDEDYNHSKGTIYGVIMDEIASRYSIEEAEDEYGILADMLEGDITYQEATSAEYIAKLELTSEAEASYRQYVSKLANIVSINTIEIGSGVTTITGKPRDDISVILPSTVTSYPTLDWQNAGITVTRN